MSFGAAIAGSGRARIGPAMLVQARVAVVIAVLGLLAAILGLLPPLLELYGRDDPTPPAGIPTMGPADPQASAVATQAPFPPDTVPPAFVGTWVGSIDQGTSSQSPYPVTLTLTAGSLGQRVGTTDYVTLGCDAHLVLADASSGAEARVVVQENLRTGEGECLDETQIILTPNPDGTLDYHIEPSGFFVSEANGTLHRQG